jgi:hypothetical protein
MDTLKLRGSRDSLTSSVPGLPRRFIRSPLPGYLLAVLVIVVVADGIVWKVVNQSEAIHAAVARTPAAEVAGLAESPQATPFPALVPVSDQEGASLTSRVSLTGASVPARPAATQASAPEPTTPGPSAAVTATPSLAAKVAAPPVAATPVPAPVLAATPSPAPAVTPSHPRARPARSRVPEDERNPYDSSSPPPAPSADERHLFDVRQ